MPLRTFSLEMLSTKIEKYLSKIEEVNPDVIEMSKTIASATILTYYLNELEKLQSTKKQKELTKRVNDKLISLQINIPSGASKVNMSKSLLFKAIEDNNSELLEALIALYPDVVKEPFTYWPERITFDNESTKVVGISTPLLQKTALTIAATQNKIELVKLLISQVEDFDINFRPAFTAMGFTTLEEVMREGGTLEMVRILLNAGATVTDFAFSLACEKSPDIAMELIKDAPKEQALISAVRYGCLPIVKHLVNLEVNVNYTNRPIPENIHDHQTPLTLAIKVKQPEIALFLIKHGANLVYAKQVLKRTALDLAIFFREANIKNKSKNELNTTDTIIPEAIKKLFLDVEANSKKKNPDIFYTRVLFHYVDTYMEKRKGKNGAPKEFLGISIFGLFHFGKSFKEKKAAIAALQQAMSGKEIDLMTHLATLRDGRLGDGLRAFVRAGYANHIIGHGAIITTVSEFIFALHTKVNQQEVPLSCFGTQAGRRTR